jgi:mannose-6-phosphate isomerase-like protein (cupin superfamily)
MQGKIRRVITGHDANGKAVVLEDGFAPWVHTNAHRPGHISVEMWKTAEMPIVIRSSEDDPTAGPKRQHPVANGTVFRISIVPPETEATRNINPEQARAAFREMGNESASTFAQNKRHPFMHRTETIDYAVVLEGEITMMLDEEEVHLRAGDVVIQRGTNHAWSNRSGKPTKMLYVLIDGKFEEELKAQLKPEQARP